MQIDLDKKTGQLSTDGRVIQSNDIKLGFDFNPSFGFDAFPNGFILVQKRSEDKSRKFKYQFRGYSYNMTLSKFTDDTHHFRDAMKKYMDFLHVNYDSDDSILGINTRINYIAIFNPAPSVLYRPYTIMLFESYGSIFDCFSNEKLFNRWVSDLEFNMINYKNLWSK